jgi:hypothetical protein
MEFYKNCAKSDTLLSFLKLIDMKSLRTSEAQENNNLYKPKALVYPVKTDPRKS